MPRLLRLNLSRIKSILIELECGKVGLPHRRSASLAKQIGLVTPAFTACARPIFPLSFMHQEAIAAVRQAPVKYVDETGWKQAGRKRWLWAAATTNVTVFLIDVFRNVTALRRLIGSTLIGILSSDRWRAYDHVELLKRQVCWAHLKRNWEKMVERGGKAKIIGERCLSVQKRVFDLWHLFRGGGCSRSLAFG
jgi:Transposase IS66 family